MEALHALPVITMRLGSLRPALYPCRRTGHFRARPDGDCVWPARSSRYKLFTKVVQWPTAFVEVRMDRVQVNEFVSVTRGSDGRFVANHRYFPGISGEGATVEEAIADLREKQHDEMANR